MEVKLTSYEILTGAHVGIMRQTQNLKVRPGTDAHGASLSDGWQLNIEGALGEMALAKALGIYWNGNIGALDAGDVGKFEARTTSRENGRLILHPSDSDWALFFLLTGVNGRYTIRGWIRGEIGKDAAYWSDPSGHGRSAYFVPQHRLHPIDQVKHMLTEVHRVGV